MKGDEKTNEREKGHVNTLVHSKFSIWCPSKAAEIFTTLTTPHGCIM